MSVDYEERFARSWNEVEEEYRRLAARLLWESCWPVVGLIEELRRRGYDRLFRAGMAAQCLVLSRSAEHGLRDDQRSVWVYVGQHGTPMEVVTRRHGFDTQFVEGRVALTPALERALADLASVPVD